ncbi:hypothetical protein VU07_04030 [Desulfobulbus sp. F4]|nr:hypothetical protein [Desulfobulbus sp. F3]MCW5200955.1 hypothetical protein [Desulfobulbus sp. F4]
MAIIYFTVTEPPFRREESRSGQAGTAFSFSLPGKNSVAAIPAGTNPENGYSE